MKWSVCIYAASQGLKNKVKPTTAQLDFTSLIAEKPSSKDALVADLTSLEENLTGIREKSEAKNGMRGYDSEADGWGYKCR